MVIRPDPSPAPSTAPAAKPTRRSGPAPGLRKQDKARTEGKLTDHQAALLDALTRHAETVAG
ncbi:hypothetical protein [Kitasatospora sp. NPDC001132]